MQRAFRLAALSAVAVLAVLVIRSTITPAQPTHGNWADLSFPVEQFSRYTSPFGYRTHPISGRRRFHSGLDIAANRGTYALAWATGTVSRVGSDNACGVHVIVRTGPWDSIFCHLEGHRVVEATGKVALADPDGGLTIYQGDQVTVGQRIGRIGMSGATTGPHLHWGLKHNGQWVDPALVLDEMKKAQGA